MMSSETSSKNRKPIRKVKLAIEKSKNPKAGVGNLDSKQHISRGSKSSQNRKIKRDDISYVGKNSSHKAKNSGKRIVKSKTKDEHRHEGVEGYEALINENRAFKPVNSDRKRKRIYADHNTGEGRTMHSKVEMPGWKALSKVGKNKLKDDMTEEKQTTKVKSHDIQRFARKNSSTGGRISKENEVLDKKCISVSGSKGKAADKIKYFELDGGGNGMLTKGVKSKSPSSKQSGQNENKHAAEFLAKYPKKKVHDKKSFTGDSEVMDGRLKKTKRVIRIDPHDITNKRLDDAIVTNDNSKEKKEDVEKNVEMSKNAQFRAIQPSLSVLSFVEDNLLGRRREIEFRRAGYNIELSAPLDNIPFSTSLERERIEEVVFRNKLKFFAAAKISSSFPSPDLPEIAFAGRSNVGKSSLLNSLTRQWGVVRTSEKPGLTQTVNFFQLGSKLCLVDLPGYGFAYAKEEVKEAWEELVKEYVSTRVGLKRVCLLIDTKWGMKPRDHELINLMERSQTKYQIVLTKTDLVFPIDVARRAMQIEESLKAKKSAVQPVMMVSSKTGAGFQSLRMALAKVARFAKL